MIAAGPRTLAEELAAAEAKLRDLRHPADILAARKDPTWAARCSLAAYAVNAVRERIAAGETDEQPGLF